MRKVIFMVGAPASGKSTFAAQLQKLCAKPGQDPQDCVPILSLDAFRHLMCPTHLDADGEHVLVSGASRKAYQSAYLAAVEAHMRVGATLILDNTHTVWRNIKDAYRLAKTYGYEPMFCRMVASEEELLARDARRHGSARVGADVIRRMLTQLESLRLPEGDTVHEVGAHPEQMLAADAASVGRAYLTENVRVDTKSPFVIVGDVHGAHARLEAFAADVRRRAPGAHIVFAGDLFDRNTDAVRTMLALRGLREDFACTFVEGNHDAHMRRLLMGDESARTRFAETARTYDTLKGACKPDLLEDMRQIVSELQSAAVLDACDTTYVVTHAGIATSLAHEVAHSGCIPPHTSVADFVYGCGRRDALYQSRHPSSYDQVSIAAADGEDGGYPRVVQVHGHRPAPRVRVSDTHIDLETAVWTPEGALTTLWVDASGNETICSYH